MGLVDLCCPIRNHDITNEELFTVF